jgi:alpha-amylase
VSNVSSEDHRPSLLNPRYSYYFILRGFQSSSASLRDLATGLDTIRGIATDPSLYGSFLENHDVERFAFFNQDKVTKRPTNPLF